LADAKFERPGMIPNQTNHLIDGKPKAGRKSGIQK